MLPKYYIITLKEMNGEFINKVYKYSLKSVEELQQQLWEKHNIVCTYEEMLAKKHEFIHYLDKDYLKHCNYHKYNRNKLNINKVKTVKNGVILQQKEAKDIEETIRLLLNGSENRILSVKHNKKVWYYELDVVVNNNIYEIKTYTNNTNHARNSYNNQRIILNTLIPKYKVRCIIISLQNDLTNPYTLGDKLYINLTDTPNISQIIEKYEFKD